MPRNSRRLLHLRCLSVQEADLLDIQEANLAESGEAVLPAEVVKSFLMLSKLMPQFNPNAPCLAASVEQTLGAGAHDRRQDRDCQATEENAPAHRFRLGHGRASLIGTGWSSTADEKSGQQHALL